MALRPSIVFVDDEPQVLTGLRRALHTHQSRWDMSFVASARDAIETVRTQSPALVITDLRMPEMNGLALIAALRPIAPKTRYVILSGTADFDAAQTAINESRVFRLLTKPCPIPNLTTVICDALKDQRSGPDPAHAWSAMEAFSAGVFVVHREGLHIAFANGAGRALLKARDGVMQDESGRLRALRPHDTADLAHVVQEADTQRMRHARLPRDDEKRDLCISIRAIEDQHDVVTLLVTDPDVCGSPGVEALATLFGLSAKEAHIVHVLCEGGSVEDAAELAGVTLSTARTYLKRIFAKTGTSRQADIVRLALSTPSGRAGSV